MQVFPNPRKLVLTKINESTVIHYMTGQLPLKTGNKQIYLFWILKKHSSPYRMSYRVGKNPGFMSIAQPSGKYWENLGFTGFYWEILGNIIYWTEF